MCFWSHLNDNPWGESCHCIFNICTDSLPSNVLPAFNNCQVTKAIMDKANKGALLNPCPPFYRGEEVSADVIDSEYFVGYEFKKALLEVQQAIIVYCITH